MKSQENLQIIFTFLKQECIFYSPTLTKPPENPSRNFIIQKILPIDIPYRLHRYSIKKEINFLFK